MTVDTRKRSHRQMWDIVSQGRRMAEAGDLTHETYAAIRDRISEAINNTESINERWVMNAVARPFIQDYGFRSGAAARKAYADSFCFDEEADDG